MIHQFVLGLKRPAFAAAVFPVAGVIGNLRAADVLHGDVSDDFVESAEELLTRFARRRLLGVHPHAGHFLLNGVPHVAEESSLGVMRGHAHAVHVGRGVHLVGGGRGPHLVTRPVGGGHPGESGAGHALHGVVQRGEWVSRGMKAAGEHGVVVFGSPEKEVSGVMAGLTRRGRQITVLRRGRRIARSGQCGRLVRRRQLEGGRGRRGHGRGRGRR